MIPSTIWVCLKFRYTRNVEAFDGGGGGCGGGGGGDDDDDDGDDGDDRDDTDDTDDTPLEFVIITPFDKPFLPPFRAKILLGQELRRKSAEAEEAQRKRQELQGP